MKNFSKILILTLSALLIIGSVGYWEFRPQATPVAQAACGNSYSFCQQLTIDHTQAGTADSTNFPLEFATSTDTSLATVANGGHVQNTTTQTGTSSLTVPADFVVTSDSGCTTLLNWEFEKYTPTTGNMILFFNWATLSHTTDGHPWICYGKLSATTWQGNVNGTWNTNYKAVYHFNESSMNIGQFSYDSTSANNNEEYNSKGGGTNATPTTGQVDGASWLTSANENSGASASSTFVTGTGSGSITMEGWLNFNSTHAYDGPNNDFLEIDDSSSGLNWLALSTNSGDASIFGKWEYFTGTFPMNTTTPFSISTGTWYYFDLTSDNSTLSFYINGTLVGNVAMGQARANDGKFYLSWGPLTQRTSDVKFDEIRLSNTVLTSSQITATYNNQKTGSTMVTAGAEQQAGSNAVPVASSTISTKGSVIIGKQGKMIITNNN